MLHLRGELSIDSNMKRLLLIRANEQLAGGRITRPRSLNAVPLIPVRIQSGSDFADWPAGQCDYWAERIGNYVLTHPPANRWRDSTTSRRDEPHSAQPKLTPVPVDARDRRT